MEAIIPFLGIETQVKDISLADGSLKSLKNLVPFGPDREKPMWGKIEIGDNKFMGYEWAIQQDLSNPANLTVIGVPYWQKRSHLPHNATKQDINRCLIIIHDSIDNTYKLYATKTVGSNHRIDGA